MLLVVRTKNTSQLCPSLAISANFADISCFMAVVAGSGQATSSEAAIVQNFIRYSVPEIAAHAGFYGWHFYATKMSSSFVYNMEALSWCHEN